MIARDDDTAAEPASPEEATPTAPADPSPAQDASDNAAHSPDAASPTTDDAATPLAQSGGEGLLHLHDAAPRLGLTVKELRRLVRVGTIQADLYVKERPRFKLSTVSRLVAERAATTAAAVEPDAIAERDDYAWCET